MKALSIRQPWAHMIMFNGKDIENRRWRTNYRGRVYIHASRGFDHYGYDLLRRQLRCRELGIPHISEYTRGGIIGTVEIIDCVDWHSSRWFYGPWGFVLTDPRPLPFKPCRGALKFFEPKGE